MTSTTMTSTTTRRRLAAPVLVLSAALGLVACGGGGADTAGTGSSSTSEHGGGHSTDTEVAKGNDADVAFLTGMTPHHEQAVEMSDIVLRANPPAAVTALATRIKQAQAPEIQQMEQLLTALGEEPASAEHGAGHAGGHSGMMSEQEMVDLRAATGTEAARLYLEGMIKHHRGAVEASDREIADGTYAPAIDLAEQIRTAQQAEITEMQALLDAL